jgi:hypothetical protein
LISTWQFIRFFFGLFFGPEDGKDKSSERLTFNSVDGVISKKTEFFLKRRMFEAIL